MKHLIIILSILLIPVNASAFWNPLKWFDDAAEGVVKKGSINASKRSVLKAGKRVRDSVVGKVFFKSTHLMGRFGDYIAAKRLTAMGYTKLRSKVDDIHGIDGVFVKRNSKGGVDEIIIVENKVNNATLSKGPPKQMSDEWINKKLGEMAKSNNNQTRQTAEIIKNKLATNPDKVKGELWHHNLKTGHTSRSSVDSDGDLGDQIYVWKDVLIKNKLTEWCARDIIICEHG